MQGKSPWISPLLLGLVPGSYLKPPSNLFALETEEEEK
jgi:hypothetical protein